jgi:hypothetical protein
MTNGCITQEVAEYLIELGKYCSDNNTYEFPIVGGELRVPLFSGDHKEEFCLDISRSRIQLEKTKYQTRSRKNIVLVRVDLAGAPHRNPDFSEIHCPHIHIYVQDYEDKWAYPLPDSFLDPRDAWQVLSDFYSYCNIIQPPEIKKELFI